MWKVLAVTTSGIDQTCGQTFWSLDGLLTGVYGLVSVLFVWPMKLLWWFVCPQCWVGSTSMPVPPPRVNLCFNDDEVQAKFSPPLVNLISLITAFSCLLSYHWLQWLFCSNTCAHVAQKFGLWVSYQKLSRVGHWYLSCGGLHWNPPFSVDCFLGLVRAVPEIILGGAHFFQAPPPPGHTRGQSPPTPRTCKCFN